MLVNWHKALGLAAFATLTAMAVAGHAAELEVSATLPDSCSVEDGTMAFGTVDPSQNTPTTTTNIVVTCSTAGTVNVALDGGLYDTLGGNGRAMKRSTSNDYLNYKLYRDPSFSQELTPGTAALHPVDVGANPFAVYGKIDVQTKPGGDYADTVQITMTVN